MYPGLPPPRTSSAHPTSGRGLDKTIPATPGAWKPHFPAGPLPPFRDGLPIGAAANGFQSKGDYAYQAGFHKNRFEDGSSRAQKFGGSVGWEAYDLVAMGNTFHLGEAAVSYESSTRCTFAYSTLVDPEKWVMRILDAGGSYAGAGSYGPYDFDSLLWDLNRDGTYDTSGQTAQVPYEYLTLLGMGFGTHLIELKAAVTNEYNTLWDLGFAELTMVNHPGLTGDANADNVVDGLD